MQRGFVEIDQISNSQINQLQPSQLNDRTRLDVAGAEGVTSKDNSKDALLVDISKSVREARSSYAQNLEQSTTILASAQIAQKSLQTQEEMLTKMQDAVSVFQAGQKSNTNLNDFKNKIYELSQNFQTSNDLAVYENENIISTQISSQIAKPSDIVSQISSDVAKLKIDDDVSKINTQINSGLELVGDYKKVFEQIQDDAVAMAKDVIESQKTLEQDTQKANAKNFGKESSDFGKNNILSQVGYFLASQANANQDANIKLLTLK